MSLTRSAPPVVLLLLLLTQCMEKAAIWILPGATSTQLTFGIARVRGSARPVVDLRSLSVKTCYTEGQDQISMWTLSGQPPNAKEVPTRIIYGLPPAGFVPTQPPAVLTQGCYEASVSGHGVSASVRFLVNADGSIAVKVD